MKVPSDQYADVVIVGAGHAGLNALVAANKYIGADQHVLIADILPTFSGHWQETYDYIRLHQPYQFFTAYDKPWALKTDSRYLATGRQVFEHLESIGKGEMKNHGTKTLFEHRYIGHEVRDKEVHVSFESVHDPEAQVVVRTKKLIDACPLSHPQPDPFKVSSSKVTSVTPNMLTNLLDELKQQNTNTQKCRFVVIGSGKTAMDTVKFLDECIDAPQALVAGNGMTFLCRDVLFPQGKLGQMFGGRSLVDYFAEAVTNWDGNNEAQVFKDFIAKGRMVSSVDDPKSCYWGIMSRAEIANVKRIIGDNIVMGRMADVIDVDGEPTLVMEDGTKKAIPGLQADDEKIFVVNCSTRMFMTKPVKPLLTGNDMVLSPQTAFLLPGQTASVFTHLWFLGKLKEVEDGFYRVDFFASGKDKEKFFFKSSLGAIHNMLVAFDVLPQEILVNDLTNPGKWYPFYRQLLSMIKAKSMREMVEYKSNDLLGPGMKYSALKCDNDA